MVAHADDIQSLTGAGYLFDLDGTALAYELEDRIGAELRGAAVPGLRRRRGSRGAAAGWQTRALGRSPT